MNSLLRGGAGSESTGRENSTAGANSDGTAQGSGNGTTDPDAPGNFLTREGGPVPIGSNDRVFVRAHMNDAGFNGTLMVGSAAQGFVLATDVAPDFALSVENESPQPNDCLF